MKIIKKIIYLMGVTTVVAFSACSESWLNPDPENQLVTQDSTFLIPANAEKFVNACYNQLTLWQTSSFSFVGYSSITSDDADKGSDPGDLGSDKDQMDNITYTSTSGSIGEAWTGNFNGVTRCNQAIENVPKYNIVESLKTRYIAEARFLRALYYFNLVRCFGDVPLINKVIDADNTSDLELANTRVAASAIYAFIEDDLNFAIENLPLNTEYAAADLGRATKGAATGLLAKVSMYEKKWDAVLALTNKIIANQVGTYGLVTDYATIWREVGENSSESLFEIQARGITPNAGIDGYVDIQGPRGSITYSDGTSGISGWGFNTPSNDLEHAYEAGDLRKAATIMYRGQTLWDGAVLGADVANERYNYKAYVSKKMESFNGNDWSANKNIRVLRMGEIYLMNAEAANELGEAGLAQTSLDLVRKRAGLEKTTASSKTDLRTAIWNERRVELAMEHDRFFDLIRQGRAGEVLRALGKNFVDGKNELFPIPQTEIDASGGKLKQNPGY
ncbi:MAG TPA: RagB/SusD family nutrient uptake outer membrane protein [Bacteroidales bacterium]|nr:RagB/SusD family nutrient uptake outer membrane protein [Bacteroidales bacterium]